MKKLLVLVFFFCFQRLAAQDDFVMLGSGGGFAGTATVYKICSNGQVFKGKGLGEVMYREKSKIGRSTAKKFFKEVKAHVTTVPDFNHPGNQYYFIGLSEKSSTSRITWGDMEHPIDKEVEKLYQEMTSAITPLTFVPVKK